VKWLAGFSSLLQFPVSHKLATALDPANLRGSVRVLSCGAWVRCRLNRPQARRLKPLFHCLAFTARLKPHLSKRSINGAAEAAPFQNVERVKAQSEKAFRGA
jgi:hypothetical protein